MPAKPFETYFLLGLLGVTLALTVVMMLPFTGPVVLGAALAIVFKPFYGWIRANAKQSEGIAAFTTTLLIAAIVCVPLVFFGIRIVNEAADLYGRMLRLERTGVQDISPLIARYTEAFDITSLTSEINTYVKQGLGWLLDHTGAIFSGVLQTVFFFIFTLLALYYFLKDGDRFLGMLLRLSPLSESHAHTIVAKLKIAANSVVRGTLVVALAQGTLAGIGFAIFGVPSATFWGLVTTFATFIPIFGGMIIILPAALYLIVTKGLVWGIGLVLWGTFVVGLVDNILRPILIERETKIHPFLILLSVLGGISMFGPIGILLGPLLLSFLFALLEVYGIIILGKEEA